MHDCLLFELYYVLLLINITLQYMYVNFELPGQQYFLILISAKVEIVALVVLISDMIFITGILNISSPQIRPNKINSFVSCYMPM